MFQARRVRPPCCLAGTTVQTPSHPNLDNDPDMIQMINRLAGMMVHTERLVVSARDTRADRTQVLPECGRPPRFKVSLTSQKESVKIPLSREGRFWTGSR